MTKNKNGAVPSQQRRSVVTKNSVTMFNDDSTTGFLDHKTPAEVLAHIAKMGATLHMESGGLFIDTIVDIPHALELALRFHKNTIKQFVGAYPDRRWPSWRRIR